MYTPSLTREFKGKTRMSFQDAITHTDQYRPQ